MHTYINIYFIYIDVFKCHYVHFKEAAVLPLSCIFHGEYIWRHTQTLMHAHTHTHVNSYKSRHTFPTHTSKCSHNSTITSQHPPLYSNQGWKYHQTGPDPWTCVAIFPGQTLEKVSRDSSSPSSSYASGPRGPPWTEARTRKGRNRDSERGRRRENRKVMVDIWGQVSHVVSSGISGISALPHQRRFRGPHTPNLVYSFTFSRRFCPKRLTNEDIRSNQNQQKSNNMQVLWQVLVSLTQYT